MFKPLPATRKIGWLTATNLVIANMIGTGVFTSLGYQLDSVQNTYSIVLLWLAGGVLALIGAFTFAELGTHYRRSGGDYVFVSEALHPLLGYLTAWTSLVVGFSAPVAIAAIAMEAYLAPFGWGNLRWLTVALVVAISLVHSFSVEQSGRFQNIVTVFKLVFVLALLLLGMFFLPAAPNNALLFDGSYSTEIFTSGFAVSLLYVSYAYTGWNAAAYIAGEMDKPQRNLPRALIVGTLLVTVVYVLLQLVMLRLAPAEQMAGKDDVTIVAFGNVVGQQTVRWISSGIALQLVATMSSYIWVGSRITQIMAADYPLWSRLSRTNAQGIPVAAIWAQALITIVLLFSGKLEQILLYASFVLQLMSTLTVVAYLYTPATADSFRSPARPYLQWFFVLFNTGVLLFILRDRPIESGIGLLILLLGVVTYAINKRFYTTA